MSLFEERIVSGAADLHGLRFDLAAMSGQGPRPENQDAYSIDAFASTGVLAVADGMGGERSGRHAADTALRALTGGGTIASLEDARRVVRAADAEVAREAERDPGAHGGMGCALGLLSLSSRRGDGVGWIGAHVGDVRILSRAPDGTVRLETRDHTPAFARWEAGEIALDEIPDTSGANRLQRAVGRGGEADAVWLPARPGWSWLIISDGVYKVVRLDELGEMMAIPDAASACDVIRRKVEERGPEDNFTAVLVRAVGGPSTNPAAAAPGGPPAPERTEPMMHSPPPARSQKRSGLAIVALVVALVALGVGAFAAYTAWRGREEAATRTDTRAIRTSLDSLDSRVRLLEEPFGPEGELPGDTADSIPSGPGMVR